MIHAARHLPALRMRNYSQMQAFYWRFKHPPKYVDLLAGFDPTYGSILSAINHIMRASSSIFEK